MTAIASDTTSLARPTAQATVPIRHGDLRTFATAFEVGVPRAGSKRFRAPDGAETAAIARLAVSAARLSDPTGPSASLDDVAHQAAALRWNIRIVADTGDDDALSVVMEDRRSRRNWGLWITRVAAAPPIVVEAPHPLADTGTPAVAIDVYRRLRARVLLVAGAHRRANADGSADAAHSMTTPLAIAHAALASAEPLDVIQIHGFDRGRYADYPAVVLGAAGDGSDALLHALESALDARQVSYGLCIDGAWRALCGTTNVQALHIGRGRFLHVELADAERVDDAAVVAALGEVFAAPPRP